MNLTALHFQGGICVNIFCLFLPASNSTQIKEIFFSLLPDSSGGTFNVKDRRYIRSITINSRRFYFFHATSELV